MRGDTPTLEAVSESGIEFGEQVEVICLANLEAPGLGFVRQSALCDRRREDLPKSAMSISRIDMERGTQRYDFASDNTAAICPEAWSALEAANHDRAPSYGDDLWTSKL